MNPRPEHKGHTHRLTTSESQETTLMVVKSIKGAFHPAISVFLTLILHFISN